MQTAALRAAARVVGALPAGSVEFRAAMALRRVSPEGLTLPQRLRGGARLDLELSDHTQGVAFFSRRYEPEVVGYLVSRLPVIGGVMVDVGANVGLITLQVAQHRPRARFECLEAMGLNAQRLRRNRELNSPSMEIHVEQVAVSDHIGTATFKVGKDSGWGHLSWEGEVTTTADHEVHTTTLDNYCERRAIDHIHVMKMDIEGAEPAALRGAERLLSAGAIDAIVSEAHLDRRQELEQILGPHGFRAVDLPPVGLHRYRPSRQTLEIGFIRQ